MKMPHKIREVTREFVAYPLHFAREPALRQPHIMHAFVELSCGHIKRDPWDVYANETAVRVQSGLRAFAEAVGEKQKPRRCRCYQCAKVAA